MSPTIQKLLKAKELSDKGDYSGKTKILLQMMKEHPKSFYIDSMAKYPGITHAKTKFKFHLPAKVIPTGTPVKINRTHTEWNIDKKAATKGWVAKVMAGPDMLALEPGLFTKKSPRAIAKSMLQSVKASPIRKGSVRSSGISMMSYYLNRGGKNIDPKRKAIIMQAKEEYRRLINKNSAVQEPLQPYQERAVKRITDPSQNGLIIAHGTGTGKTRQSIEAYKRLKMPTTVVVPAALRANYQKELQKWVGRVPNDINIESQQAIARQGLRNDPKNGLLVVDEAHRARTPTSSLIAQLRQTEAKKRLLLTATPVFNHPTDMATLVNFAANKSLLPTDKKRFNDMYVNYKEVKPNFLQRMVGVRPGVIPELKNRNELGKILHKYIDYYGGSQEGFPVKKEEEIKVPMGDQQQAIYKTIMGKAPLWMRWKVKAGLPPGRQELDAMRAFLGGARQVSNTTQGFVKNPDLIESAKIQKAFDYFRKNLNSNPRYKGVVYSNYLQSGLDPYKQLMNQYNIPYGEFSGEINPRVRNKMVQDYNKNKLRALLISSAGSEGLDLRGTRLIQILEPHFNEEKERQIIGRGIRYHSHDDLPPSEQQVQVQRYLAQPKATLLDRIFGNKDVKGADEYIRNMAMQKDMLTKQITNLLDEQNRGLKKRSALASGPISSPGISLQLKNIPNPPRIDEPTIDTPRVNMPSEKVVSPPTMPQLTMPAIGTPPVARM